MSTPTYTAGETPEMMDSRDLIEWAEYYYDCETDEERATLAAIEGLEAEGWEDWQYGAQFIREDYFTTYAQQLAEDCNLVPDTSAWPNYCIDWEWAARELKHDYSVTSYLGVDYYAVGVDTFGGGGMTTTITKWVVCPDCGGELQATREEYLSGLKITLDEHGGIADILDDGRYVMSGDTHVYCENDCPRWA